ncbi:7TM diverse intracellular signaling domain-containing protein [Flavobacterium sp. 7A]|uniref:7TM diverse intracellular signaling domain-containing protein n=1 Tax=Flavobacterium sp. 7A TaxID=2940571 RepID=UPI002225F4A4|nr:7TM diverse intracellular signaling domain-containing protein [Flavobacterium sp. 7A]MCW2120013.1 CheY-like chemotaxis protein [Flavobacterium sp. 7A]
MHLKSDGEVIKMPLLLSDSDSFNDATAFKQFIFGIFYGILLIAAIIYFFFYYALRERTFLYYSLYVLLVGCMQLSLDGFFYKYIDPSGGWVSQHAVLIFAMSTGILLGKYSEVFLKIKEHSRFLYLAFNVAFGLAFVLIVAVVFVPAALPLCYPIANLLGLFILILIISSIVSLVRKKIKVDAFLAVGILFLILGFGVFILNNFGLMPNNFFVQNSSKFGTGLEVIFLSLSMANLIRNLHNEPYCVITMEFPLAQNGKINIVQELPKLYNMRRKTILVVEDNSINQMVINMILKKWSNTKVVFANNGQEALDAFTTHTIDIILMDLQMPVMDGYEATIAIQNGVTGLHNANVLIIAVTADMLESTKNRVFEIGMNDYLTKPIKKETLFEAVSKILQLTYVKNLSA